MFCFRMGLEKLGQLDDSISWPTSSTVSTMDPHVKDLVQISDAS